MPPRKRAATRSAPAKKATPRKRRPTKAELAETERVARLQRARDVLELRRGGIGFDKIAIHPEVLPEGVTQLDREELYALYELAVAETLPQPADQVRRLELDRLERLIPRLYTKALSGDPAAAKEVRAIAKLRVEIAERRAPLESGRVPGPTETKTIAELADLKVRDSMGLSESALILARWVDEAATASSGANAARELRMTMAALRGLHGQLDGGRGGPLHDPDGPDEGEKPTASGEVVPPSRLAEVRRRHEQRGSKRGK